MEDNRTKEILKRAGKLATAADAVVKASAFDVSVKIALLASALEEYNEIVFEMSNETNKTPCRTS